MAQFHSQASTYEELISVLSSQPQFVTSVKQAAGIVGKGSSGSAALSTALREAAVAALSEEAEEIAAEAFTLWAKMKATPEPSWAKTPLAGLLLLPYTGYQWMESAGARKKVEDDATAAEAAEVAAKLERSSTAERKREEKLARRKSPKAAASATMAVNAWAKGSKPSEEANVASAEAEAALAEELKAAKASAVKDKEAVRAAKRNLKKYCDKQEEAKAFPAWKDDALQEAFETFCAGCDP